ncbi:MAG: GGDEF domain-containing protein [Tissierellia bacterium]|nr:GGDEF domain-containing protein [Tissierellia bacterium]MDD4779498.1 GGDEF domain-containing protein [Tissierellia bacterium]
MEKFFDYISDAAIKCRIVQREDNEKVDLQAIYANKRMEFITNVPNEKIINRNMTDVFPKMNDIIFDWPKIFCEAAMTNEFKVIEQYFVAFEKYLRFTIFGYKDGCFDVLITDLTQKKEIKRQLLERDRQIKLLQTEVKEKANIEMLTKLYNFQFVMDCLRHNIENYNVDKTNFCIFILDIDDFNTININYGIGVGDKILQNVALILKANERKIDVAGRLEKDRFILILNNISIDIAKIMVEKIKHDINKKMEILGYNVTISGSLIEFSGQTLEVLLSEAESKLNKAKTLGKGSILS